MSRAAQHDFKMKGIITSFEKAVEEQSFQFWNFVVARLKLSGDSRPSYFLRLGHHIM